jgi:hypothetical protein
MGYKPFRGAIEIKLRKHKIIGMQIAKTKNLKLYNETAQNTHLLH